LTLGAGDAGCDAPGDAGRLAPCDGMRQQGAMKTSIPWSPRAGLNVVDVERRERAWTVTVDSRQPTFCPECGAQGTVSLTNLEWAAGHRRCVERIECATDV
jgi:hypothetical protein